MYQLRRKKSMWGFTTVELMVVMVLFSIIMGVSYALMTSGTTTWYVGDTKIQLQEDLRRAMDIMASELSVSAFGKLTIGAGGNSITFQTPVDENGSGSWEDTDADGQGDFYLENTLDASGNVRWGAYLRREDRTVASDPPPREGREVTFLLVGGELRRRVRGSDASILEDFPLARNIQNLSFVRRSGEVIEINIDANKLTKDRRPIDYSLTTEVHLGSIE